MLVKFNSTRTLGFKEKIVIPGLNDLDPDFVADMMDDDILAGKFDRGELEVLDAEDIGAKKVKTKNGAAPTGVDLLLAASDKNSIALAAKTVDLNILNAWLLREKRVPVRKAIKAQVDKIKNIEYRDEKSKASKYGKPAPSTGEEE